jgi:hypothetical protein
MPILVLAIDPYQYWHYMIHTSTGRHTKMPVLVLARVAKRKIPLWASTEYAHTGISNRTVPVLALNDPYQYWQTYENAHTGISTSSKKKNTSMGIDLVAHVGCHCWQFWGPNVVLADMSATRRQMSGRHLATSPHFGPRQCHDVLVGCRHVGFTYVGTNTKSTIVLTHSVLR